MKRCAWTVVAMLTALLLGCAPEHRPAMVQPPNTAPNAVGSIVGYCVAKAADATGIENCFAMGQRLRANLAGPAQASYRSASPSGSPRNLDHIRWVAQTARCDTNITWRHYNASTVAIIISGEISDGCELRLAAVFDAVIHERPAGKVSIILDSPGGSIAAAYTIAQAVAMSELPVILLPGAKCASACFVIFAAAKTRYVSHRALVGVHSASERGAEYETVRSEAVTTEMARVCAALGVPPAILGRMVTTPPGDIAWLTEDDLALMGTRFFPVSVDPYQ